MTHLSSVVRFIHSIKQANGADSASDANLLSRYIDRQDEPAFAALVTKYGPMVLAVCRRILRDHHEAEDAMQATFLVLSRKAGSLQRRENLSNWLHGVAVRVSLKARKPGRQFWSAVAEEGIAAPDSSRIPEWNDLRVVIDEEIARLPRKYREPFVLCYLAEKTNAVAAEELNCPEGTVVTRLGRARAMLRKRLGRRGVTLSAAGGTAALSQGFGPTPVSAALILCVTKCAFQCGPGLKPALAATFVRSAIFANGVVEAMNLTNLKTSVIAIVAGVGILLAAGSVTYRVLADDGKGTTPVAQQDSKQKATAAPRGDSVSVHEVTHDMKDDNQTAPPMSVTTFYVPILDGGKKGPPVPFTITVSGVPNKNLHEVMGKITAGFHINFENMPGDEKLNLIFERLERMEQRLNVLGQKLPELKDIPRKSDSSR